MVQPGCFDIETRLSELSAHRGPLERLWELVDWESFRPVLAEALRRSDRLVIRGAPCTGQCGMHIPPPQRSVSARGRRASRCLLTQPVVSIKRDQHDA